MLVFIVASIFSITHLITRIDAHQLGMLAYRYPRALGGLIVIAALANVIVVSRQLF